MAGPRPIELLSPAKDVVTGREAILHGADAVYIGASSHGARKSASNSVAEIAELVSFAHGYRAKVYVTVNTLVYEDEIKSVETLIRELYIAGVDALIVQDMGILRMNIPPIELHASTQCDTRSPEKAKFLEEAGFSQIVLARELSLQEIGSICNAVTVPIECFIHGALCVSYSGRCNAGYATAGRSANRGECPQICRLPFTLKDSTGKVICRDKHLLSLRDFNASTSLSDLLSAGVSSFKIEGRLKGTGYVKNITAYYRQLIDKEIAKHPDKYCRSSYGEINLRFTPDPHKSFNRGFTDYFLRNRRPSNIASLLTPKSLGERVVSIKDLQNGDGISYFDRKGNYSGSYVNGVNPDGTVRTSSGERLSVKDGLRLTFDKDWEKLMDGKTSERKIRIDVEIDAGGVTAKDERGNVIRVPIEFEIQSSDREMDMKAPFSKLGNTIYKLNNFTNRLPENSFLPLSYLTSLRREVVAQLDRSNETTYRIRLRRVENPEIAYPVDKLVFSDNVSNSLSRCFYLSHGVKEIEAAMETNGAERVKADTVLMTTRHCILRELGMCMRDGNKVRQPLTITHSQTVYKLKFDCRRCEMQVLKS